jgi:acetyl-CoA carboxylase biotin carboxyl carrier protein
VIEMMLYKRIKRLIEILDEEGIDEIEVRSFFTSVRVARRTDRIPAARSEAHLSVREEGTEGGGPKPGETEDHLEKIISPMVGTYYESPKPDADPFVFEGKRVEQGEVLCIIEAMKLMNEIEAEKSGIIRKILVKDSEPVEYGQPLFLVESA